MTDQKMPFDQQLGRAFAVYAERAPQEVDARALAAMLVAGGPASLTRPARGRVGRWPRAYALIAATLLLGVVAAGALVIGSQRGPQMPTVEVPVVRPSLAPRFSYEGVWETTDTLPSAFPPEPLVTLGDGRVLVLRGGWPERKPQSIWDPATGRFTAIAASVGRRSQPIGVLLLDGRVLIIGGDTTDPVYDADGGYSGTATYSTAELFDPATGTFTPAGPMVGKGWAPAAIRLADGRVLVLDGNAVDGAASSDPLLRTAELYDPATDTFTATGEMTTGAGGANMALLPDGRVLLVGGFWPEMNHAEIFDPVTATFTRTDDLPTDGLHPQERDRIWPSVAAAAVPLPDGRVLVPGRRCEETNDDTGASPTIAAIFDPVTETFTATTPMPHCVEQAIPLPDGRIFLRGFWVAPTSSPTNWSGIYDPADGSVTETGAPPAGRYMQAVALPDGRLLARTEETAYVFR
jgi:hypothetical protein